MKGMLIKDFKLLKSQKQYWIIIFLFAFLFISFTNQYYFVITYMIIAFVLSTMITIAYDEDDNGNLFLFTLPISRRIYVREKYALCIILMMIGCVADLIMIVILKCVKKNSDMNLCLLFIAVAASFAAGILMMAFVIPLQMKLGAEKRQMALFVSFAVSGVVLYSGKMVADLLGIPKFLIIWGGMSVEMLIALAFIFVLVWIFISYKVSVHIMEKKEF